eukprot:7539930-Pyramimonas_sp.AAC.1
MAKAKPELLDAMKKVIEKCDVCDATKHPKSTPPARLPTPESFEFNEVIGMDLLFVDTTWDSEDKPKNETT